MTENLIWTREDGTTILHEIINQIRRGDEVVANFEDPSGYSYMVSGKVWWSNGPEKIVGDTALRDEDGRLNPKITSLFATVRETVSF